MSDTLTIPWADAQQFAEAHGCDQIIVWGYASGRGQCVATWGRTVADSDQAATGGNYIKTALLNWPESEALAVPDRVQTCLEALCEARRLMAPMAKQIISPKDSVLGRCVKQLDHAISLFEQ